MCKPSSYYKIEDETFADLQLIGSQVVYKTYQIAMQNSVFYAVKHTELQRKRHCFTMWRGVAYFTSQISLVSRSSANV